MSSKTKIVVLRMKEIIYTAIFAGLGLLLIALLFIMFRPGKEAAETAAQASPVYIPGVYSVPLTLGGQEVNVEVCVDADHITSVSCTPLSEAVETMYPLLEPAAADLSAQLAGAQSLENLTWPEGSQHTSRALAAAAKQALQKAAVLQD